MMKQQQQKKTKKVHVKVSWIWVTTPPSAHLSAPSLHALHNHPCLVGCTKRWGSRRCSLRQCRLPPRPDHHAININRLLADGHG